MFQPNSRYFNLPTLEYLGPDGRVIAYKARRLLAPGSSMPVLQEVSVTEGDRLDLISARTLGDPEQYWRISDANDALDPFELTQRIGRVLRVPVPQF